MQQVISGLPANLHVPRVKRFLEEKKKKEYQTRLAETQEETERRKETFGADPEHGGKMAAMTLSIFESIAPKSAIGLIDKLLGEISFLEEEGVSPKEILDRLISICDADGE
jgi:hypothetical protein